MCCQPARRVDWLQSSALFCPLYRPFSAIVNGLGGPFETNSRKPLSFLFAPRSLGTSKLKTQAPFANPCHVRKLTIYGEDVI